MLCIYSTFVQIVNFRNNFWFLGYLIDKKNIGSTLRLILLNFIELRNSTFEYNS